VEKVAKAPLHWQAGSIRLWVQAVGVFFLVGTLKHRCKEKIMYTADVERMVQLAEKKAGYLRSNPMGYLVLSVLAGVYLGFGICLIFSVGAPFWAEGSAGFKLVMGVSFGIALTLVIFAGSELFTGNNMVCAFGALAKAITMKHVGLIFFWSFVGNLAGSLGLAWLVAQSGVVGQAPQSGRGQNESADVGTVHSRDSLQLARVFCRVDSRPHDE
jgi:formate/nitrite transporter FocA (FNT family)